MLKKGKSQRFTLKVSQPQFPKEMDLSRQDFMRKKLFAFHLNSKKQFLLVDEKCFLLFNKLPDEFSMWRIVLLACCTLPYFL